MDAAVANLHEAITPSGNLGVVSDDDEGGLGHARRRGQHLHYLVAGGLVEGTGGFVGENDGRMASEGAGDSNALGLAAGH